MGTGVHTVSKKRRKGRIDECEDEWVKERFRGEWDKYRL